MAEAADPAVAIVSFENRCFDAARVAERVRPARGNAGQEVVVVFGDTTVEITLTLRTSDGRVSGLEVRRLAAELPCETLLEATERMVARTATPLQFRPQLGDTVTVHGRVRWDASHADWEIMPVDWLIK